jgi:hypothetical protein
MVVNTTVELSSDEDEQMGSTQGTDSGTSSPSSFRIQLSITPTPPPSPPRLVDTTIELSSDEDEPMTYSLATAFFSAVNTALDSPDITLSTIRGADSGTSSPSSFRIQLSPSPSPTPSMLPTDHNANLLAASPPRSSTSGNRRNEDEIETDEELDRTFEYAVVSHMP